MESMEVECEEGENTIKRLKTNRFALSAQPVGQESSDIPETPEPPFCIFKKLEELHEELAQDPTERGLKPNSHLLDKLVARERLNTVILNLYPGNKGYSLGFRCLPRDDVRSDDIGTMVETELRSYEEDDLLRCVDNEQLPPTLVDVLEKSLSDHFYNGCVIAEVRDYRQAYPHFKCDIHHVLLRPTLSSLFADMNNMMEEFTGDEKSEDKQQLESQLLLAHHPTLCLDPDNSVSAAVCRINRSKRLWSTHAFRRTARKYSQVTVNRKRKLDQFTRRQGLELYEFVTRNRTKPKTLLSPTKVQQKKCEEIKPIPVPNLDPPQISPPSQEVVINEFKLYQRPTETSDCLPEPIEEYILETEMNAKGKACVYIYIKLSILQRPSNSEYIGELYMDRDYKQNERNGLACRFSLGSMANASRYVRQFTEMYTESGKKSVRIRHGLCAGYKKKLALAEAQNQAQNFKQNNLVRQHIYLLSQSLQNQEYIARLANRSVSLHHPNSAALQNSTTIPILQSQLQGTTQVKPIHQQQVSNQQLEINALANKLMNCAQQYQAAVNAKQQQKSGNNAAIINLLNSSPASSVNSDASAAVVNAINSSPLLPINQKLLQPRKMTIPNARVLNHSNLIAINNNSHPQTITLTSVNSGNFANYTTVPVKQQVLNQRILTNNSDNKSALSALLVGTPAADRPDIVGPNTNSLLLEKLANASNSTNNFQSSSATHFIQSPKSNQQQQPIMVQSPKRQTVLTPLSSPPPQTSNTINVQSLNFAQLQSIPGLQNVQVQLHGFHQPISLSLNVSSTGNIQGHPASLIVSLPVTTATATVNTITQAGANSSGVNSIVGPQTVVLANATSSSLAQLVSTGVKGITPRTGTSQTVTLSQGGQPFQLITPLQRPRLQTQNVTSRTIQRTPITIKMASPSPNATQDTSQASIASQLQQFQQLCVNQPTVLGKIRRRSNAMDPQ